jgi:hypothetical protein
MAYTFASFSSALSLLTFATRRPVSNYPRFHPCYAADSAFLEGLSVDEAFTLFNDGFGVKKSKEMRREKIQMQKNYRAEGAHWTPVEVGDKDKSMHVEEVRPTHSDL